MALHSGFNMLLVKPALAALAMLLVLPPGDLPGVSPQRAGLEGNWLDEDLDDKVRLLELVNTGHFLGQSPSAGS